jgi:hypothetical protein
MQRFLSGVWLFLSLVRGYFDAGNCSSSIARTNIRFGLFERGLHKIDEISQTLMDPVSISMESKSRSGKITLAGEEINPVGILREISKDSR